MLSPIKAVTHPDPYPYYASLVAERPLYMDEELGCWVAADAATVAAVLAEDACLVRPSAEPVPKGLVGTTAGEVFGDLVRMTDGEPHARMKRVVVDALAGVDVGTVSALAAERTRKQLADADAPSWDDLMFGVPSQVVAILCGLEDADAEEATVLVAEFVKCLPPSATAEQQAAAAAAAARLRELMGRLASDWSAGLLGELVRAAGRTGWELKDPLLANGIGFLSQTYEATAGLIGNSLVALRRGTAQPAPFAADPEANVREVARYDSPVHTTRRFAARSFELMGRTVEKDQAILVLLAAANRDPAANPRPEVFDPERPDARLFTFGSGRHGCPGQPLAVAIAAAVVGELLADGLEAGSIPAEVSYRPSANVRIPILSEPYAEDHR